MFYKVIDYFLEYSEKINLSSFLFWKNFSIFIFFYVILNVININLNMRTRLIKEIGTV